MPEEKKRPTEIHVVMEGGCVRAVYSSEVDTCVQLIDLDDVKAGDEHPLLHLLDDSGEVIWEKTRTPHAVW